MLGQQRLEIREQLRAGQEVEEAVGIGVFGTAEDVALLPRDSVVVKSFRTRR